YSRMPMPKSKIFQILTWVIVLAAAAAPMARAEVAASEPTAATDTEAQSAPAVKDQEQTLYPVPNYGGDGWSRSYLTGDWGGLRTRLAHNGVQLELSLTQIFQDVSSGGTNRTGRYSGSADIILKLDSQKLGLWPGGFLFVEAQAPYGNTVIPYAGG